MDGIGQKQLSIRLVPVPPQPAGVCGCSGNTTQRQRTEPCMARSLPAAGSLQHGHIVSHQGVELGRVHPRLPGRMVCRAGVAKHVSGMPSLPASHAMATCASPLACNSQIPERAAHGNGCCFLAWSLLPVLPQMSLLAARALAPSCPLLCASLWPQSLTPCAARLAGALGWRLRWWT